MPLRDAQLFQTGPLGVRRRALRSRRDRIDRRGRFESVGRASAREAAAAGGWIGVGRCLGIIGQCSVQCRGRGAR